MVAYGKCSCRPRVRAARTNTTCARAFAPTGSSRPIPTHFSAAEKCVGIGLELPVGAKARAHVVFVRAALTRGRQEHFPYATIAQPHGMTARVPVVEIAD